MHGFIRATLARDTVGFGLPCFGFGKGFGFGLGFEFGLGLGLGLG